MRDLTRLLVLAAALSCGCRKPAADVPAPAPGPAPWFEDVTDRAGLHFVHDAGPTGRYFMPQCVGSGAALFDFDNDSRLDLYLIHNGGPDSKSTNRLFRQAADGRFEDVSAGSGVDAAGHGMGAAASDVNNDGLTDLLLTEYGRVRLFLNRGGGTFADATREAGLDRSRLWGTSAAFFDYDRDGRLDLVVANYVNYDPSRWCADSGSRQDFCGPNAFPGTVTNLYRNRGPGEAGVPRFEDVTLASGLGRVPGPGLGVFCADFDGDRWPDIFVANDGQPNRLWVNQKNGTFKNEAVARGLALNCLGQTEANMGVAVGDVDGDGLFDVFVTHLTTETNTLWRQGPRGVFQDRTAAAGLARPAWRGTGFGTVPADFDHDGDLDLVVVNGRVRREQAAAVVGGEPHPLPFWRAYVERNQVFANDGTGNFRDRSAEDAALCGTAAVARGLACGDLDNDGAPDLLVTNVAGRARLYRNVAPGRGRWLTVRCVDPALKRDAYGAEVTVEAGGRSWTRWVNPGYSYLCSNDPRAHFGLGGAGAVDAVRVVWPDGAEETFPGGPADRAVELRKGSGRAAR